ncbi:MAG: aminoglycoside 3-N-acetyltransferase [Ardenticatenaceae bacterium]|nr:aminoglycoside 3-N-acetyltransferase [Ardenticatenaceae bacterium]
MQPFVNKSQLIEDLKDLGLKQGDTIMVHASLRAVGPIKGKGEALVEAMMEVLNPLGTLMAYVDYYPTKDRPYFDAARSPAMPDHGVLAEIIRTWPGAARSENPGASMSAIGHRAHWICENHPVNYGYGENSPLAKLVEVNGKVLLLGSHLDHVTLLHYAEHLANLPGKKVIRRADKVLIDGRVEEIIIEEFDTGDPIVEGMSDTYFEMIMQDFIQSKGVKSGRIGHADSYLLDAKTLVDFAVAKMEKELG